MSGSGDSPASPRLERPPTPFSEERAQRRDRRTLRGSIVAALALWVVAGLNAAISVCTYSCSLSLRSKSSRNRLIGMFVIVYS